MNAPVTRVLTLAAFLLLSACVQAQQKDLPTALAKDYLSQRPESVLLVGNSFTFYNNGLHTLLRKLLEGEKPQAGVKTAAAVRFKSMTISGGRLRDQEDGLRQMLADSHWDVVILQGHSLEAIRPDQQKEFRQALGRLAAEIHDAGSTPLLFMTWAYSDQPGMTPELERAYQAAGAEFDIPVLPVGRAFARAESELPEVTLRISDLKHPTVAGSYLAASVLYSALFARSPENLAFDAGLDPAIALELRRIAWKTVLDDSGNRSTAIK